MHPIDLAIIGLGYVGLPLAHAATNAGLRVIGIDINPAVIHQLATGHSHIDDLDDRHVRHMLDGGFEPTGNPTRLRDANCIAICVPTPLGRHNTPDPSDLYQATATVAHHLTVGQTIVVESTVWPGCTSDNIRSILETSGLTAGDDFHLAYSPERVDPANPHWRTANTAKLLGGHTPACRDKAAVIYRQFIDTIVECAGTREAETAKLLENTQRLVNIALVNQIARTCHQLNIDTHDVLQAAATKPFGYQPYQPGPGVGGHCIPIDPLYLSWQARQATGQPIGLIELAHTINDTQPGWVADRLLQLLDQRQIPRAGATILLAGITYKPDTSDQRGTPAAEIVRRLRAAGCQVTYTDDHADNFHVDGTGVPKHHSAWRHNAETGDNDPPDSAADSPNHDSGACGAARYDLVCLLQPHRTFNLDQVMELGTVAFDATGATRGRCRRDDITLL